MTTTMKVTREKNTPEKRLKEIEAKIARAESQLEKFKAQRADLVAEVKAQADALALFVQSAKEQRP